VNAAIGDRATRAARLEAALRALQPTRVEVIDDSHRHVGHEGARDGRGHFTVVVVSEEFIGRAPIARHRMVYAAVGELMQTDIHALAIQARTPEEDAVES
jgi:BolA family transcriptional regulator, general stress-responsive regulator